MRARRTDEQAPTFEPSDVYRLALMGEEHYTAERGAPSPELLAAVAERRERQRRQAREHWARTIPTGEVDQ